MADIVQSLGPHHFFLGTFGGFSLLYFSFTLAAFYGFRSFTPYQKKSFRDGQIRLEIKRSLVSILMFSILSLFVWRGLQTGFFSINYEFFWLTFLVESSALFFWNELHFYVVHRIFHFRPFYRYHAFHHYSHVPSPFSAYSFHWSEGFALGAVMPLAMIFHDFQLSSLMTLPVVSLFLNVLGHSNIDFFPDRSTNSLLSFSKRHSLHHKNPHGNFGFFLPYFDQAFRSDKLS